jgi:radical SAM protein with 4Fe4S-binding SPASM domain
MSLRKRWEYHYHKGATELPVPPRSLNVEPTNVCNLRCGHCSLDRSVPTGYMSLDLFEAIMDQAASIGVEEIRLFLAGEPTLHKQLPEMVAGCTSRGLRSIIHSNATKLTPEKSRALIEAGLTLISVSIDGADPESYEVMRKGAKFDKTIENVQALLQLKKELGSEKPYVIIQTIRPADEPLEPPEELKALFQGLDVGHYKVLHPHNWRGESDVEAAALQNEKPSPCMFLWHELSVRWDGKVLGCCSDLNGSFIRGDLTQDSIMDVWNNHLAVALRRTHVENNHQAHPLCKNCSVPYQKQKVTPVSELYKQRAKSVVKKALAPFSKKS